MGSRRFAVAAVSLCWCMWCLAQPAGARAVPAESGHAAMAALDDSWDRAFADHSGDRPVHAVARYVDGRGEAHRLEMWRVGQKHLRRLTDDRVDLHADANGVARAGQPLEYVWQILDLKTRVDHRITSRGMLRLGMLYSYYAMAHGLSRPVGVFQVRALSGAGGGSEAEPETWHGMRGEWFEIASAGQPSSRVLWLANAGMPLRMLRQDGSRWVENFGVEQLEMRPIASSVFRVETAGFTVRDADQAIAEED